MSRISSVFVCQQCGYHSPQYLGKCPQCDNWNSFEEEIIGDKRVTSNKKTQIVNLADLDRTHYPRLKSGLDELDRTLGGGVVMGSVVLIAGDPGIGKSTLLTQVALNIKNTLYVAGEESAHQIKLRAERINNKANLTILNEVDVDIVIGVIEDLKPSLVIIDSIQTLETADLSGVPGSVGQVRECAHRLQQVAKKTHVPIFLVGHVTKEGTVAGPKTLEHLVDVVLSLEGEIQSQFRILRGNKNRFGATDEVGVFEMLDRGMVEVKNPSKLFLETASSLQTPGAAVVPMMTGLRPILVETQALVTKSNLPSPRRIGSGVDNNRLQLLVAVMQKRAGLPLFDQDIFVNVTGGLKVVEPAADLGVCLAIASSFKEKLIPPKTAFVGEVGLLGEVRLVQNLEKRIAEAKKLGFINIISAKNSKLLPQILKFIFPDKI
ncbi:DNA repair protein RadA [Candidatus Daviesbacteria bacterium]|nr:DNA repair protein RadA [Candidatus Daviesbacteria bacterium]